MNLLRVFLNTIFIRWIEANITFVILHNNDIHSRFDEFDKSVGKKMIGGIARTMYKINEFRQAAEMKKKPPVLYLNAGDTFSGTVWFSVHRWKIVSDFMNLLKPDAITLGNHEFDDGIQNLTLFAKSLPVPLLCCNCNVKNEPILKNIFQNSTIVNIMNTTIGVIGYIDSNTSDFTLCGNVTFTDEISSVRWEANKLSERGVDIIIALGHAGYEMDKKIAREVKHIDLVVGGHSNTFLWNGNRPDLEQPIDKYPKVIYSYEGVQVPVLHSFAYTKYLGYLQVTFDSKGKLKSWEGNPIFMDENVPKDVKAVRLLSEYKKALHVIQNTVIGVTIVRLNSINCRYEECNFGNLIADAFVSYKEDKYVGPYWTDCAIGFVNAGSVKISVNPGNVTVGDILEAVPYSLQLVSFDLIGRDLIKTLEIGVAAPSISEVKGEFLQVSGLKITVNRKKPPGSRVVKVFARCSHCLEPKYFPLKNNSYYRIVTNQFLADGRDRRGFLRDRASGLNFEDVKDNEAVIQYFKKVQVVNNTVDDRIVFVRKNKTSRKFSREDMRDFRNVTVSASMRLGDHFYIKLVLFSGSLCFNRFILNYHIAILLSFMIDQN